METLDYGRHDLHNPLPRYGVSSGWLVSVPNQTKRTSRSPSCDIKGAILHRQVARSPTSTAACEGKTVVQVYDYADTRVPVLKRMFEKLMKTYRALGFLDKESGRA